METQSEGKQEGKAESFFRKAGMKIDDLLKDVRESDLAKNLELESRLKELKRDKERLSNQFKDFSKENEQTFEDIKKSMEESIQDIKNLFKKAKSN